MTKSLIGQILMMIFHVEGSTGFYYENPANDWSDDENFVQERVSDDDGFLVGDGVNDDGRGRNVDDHDNRDDFYHLHGDEENVDDDNQGDDNLGSHGGICHLCICSGSVENHGHNSDDHNLTMSDDGETNNLGGKVEEVDIYHESYKDRA